MSARKIKSQCRGAYCLGNGFTLIELMLAVLIGTLVLNVLFATYLANAKIYKLQHQIALLQSNGNRASYLFKALLNTKPDKLNNIKHFSVLKTKRHYSNGEPIYSLYFEDNHGMKKEIIEGVTQIDYKCEILAHDHLLRVNCDELDAGNKLIEMSIKMNFSSEMLKREWHIYASFE